MAKSKDEAKPEFMSKDAAVKWAYEKLDELGEKADVTLTKKEVLDSKSQTRLLVFAYVAGGWVWGRVFFDIDKLGFYTLDEVITWADKKEEEPIHPAEFPVGGDESMNVPKFDSQHAAMAWARQKVRELHTMMGTPYSCVEQRSMKDAWQLRTYTGDRNHVDLVIACINGQWQAHRLCVHMQN